MNLTRNIWTSIAWGGALAVILNLPFVGPDYYHALYRDKAFGEVQVGMPWNEATKILERNGIWCGINDNPGLAACYFSDIGHNYVVRLDPKLFRVKEKSMTKRSHDGIHGW